MCPVTLTPSSAPDSLASPGFAPGARAVRGSTPAPPGSVGDPGRAPDFDLGAPEHLRHGQILIVDDEPANLAVLKRLLQRAGYTSVATTHDPLEALELVERIRPDLLLLDLWMPHMDGFQIMEAIRARASGADDMPVLVLSGDERSEIKWRALACGARDFLTKPVDLVEALLRIRNLLEIRMLHRAALQAQEARYRELVESASDLIYQTDAAGRITYANPAAARVLGFAVEELLGRDLVDLVHDEHRDEVRRFYGRQVADRRAESYREFPVVAAGGREVWLGQSLRLIEHGGVVLGTRAIARDVTARHEVERLKGELVSVISHELRTPLTSIRASLGLLASGRLQTHPEQAARMVQIANQNADRLSRMVNDLLDLDRMAAGKLQLERRSFPLDELASQALDAVRSTAEQAGILLVQGVPRLDCTLDPDRIVQVLINLVANAIKFSPRGGTVWLNAQLDGGDVRFSVRDLGRGIPPEKLEAVFERFQQVDSSDARQKGGTGLGLAICRQIVELHGG
ncbi:MAG: response regulator, partial [Gemmatimonadetes bacterium]|nr:response regulator [Gemmatimonadota bacterium]